MLKRAVKQLVASPPGWQSVGALVRPRGLRILMYHRVDPGDTSFPHLDAARFESQMRWLRRNCTLIAPGQIVDACRRPSLRRPPVLITFDDGYRDYHDVAYPILKRLGIPAVVFLATGLIDDGAPVWTDVVHWALRATPRRDVTPPWSELSLDLGSDERRAAATKQIKAFLKKSADRERRGHLAGLVDRLDVAGQYERLGRQMLSWDEVRATMDLTTYGGHSHSHPILSRLDDAALEAEIATCRRRITAETGVVTPYFAYPNGTSVDFNEATERALRRHGFTVVFSTIEGVNGRSPDLTALLRLPTAAPSDADFAWLVAGLAQAT